MVMQWVAVLSIALIGQLTLSSILLFFNIKNKILAAMMSIVHLALCGYLLVPAAFTPMREYLVFPFYIFGFFQSFIGPAILATYQNMTKKQIIPEYLLNFAFLYMLFDYGVSAINAYNGTPTTPFSHLSSAFCAIFIQAPCLLLTVLHAARDFTADLRSASRRARIIFLVVVSVAFALVILVSLALTAQDAFSGNFFSKAKYDWRYDMYYIGVSVFAGAYALLISPFLLVRHGLEIFQDLGVGDGPVVDVQADASSVDPDQLRLLQHLMDVERVYTNSLLSIGALADRMDIPSHQLRALINKGLGWRNFNQFLNSYRLADAKAVLADSAMARTPILTIALDLGFGSAPSFNRVFKAEIGMTPTDYREQALGHPPVESTGDLVLSTH